MDLIAFITKTAIQGRYFLLFFAYIIEGPIFGFISAIIASAGYLNIYIIFLLLIIGEIGADVIYYFLGKRFSESRINRKLDKYENTGILNTIKGTLSKHPIRTLIFVKSVAFIAVPSLLLIGKYKALKFWKFLLWTTIICLVKDITVIFLGYGLGISLESFLNGYDIYKIVGAILAVAGVGYIIIKTNREKIEEFTLKSLKKIE